MTLIRNCFLALSLTALLPAANAQINADAAKALAERHLCLACHKIDEKLVGPAYRDVAKKYQGVAGAQDTLIAKVKKGGKGVWGTVAMPPHTNASNEDLKSIVGWILSLPGP